MTSSISSTNDALDTLANSYVNRQTEEEDPLGRDAFLTMLVAQLENQDPLNPMDGTDFTAQLAQFSNLEQQFNINSNLEEIISVLESKGESNLIGYIGKEISATVDTINVSKGNVSTTGYFELKDKTNVLAAIYDENGELVKSMSLGTLNPGEHSLKWNGKDAEGVLVEDGEYSYELMALNDAGGYAYSISPKVTGEVDGVVYRDGVGYLTVGDALVDPARVVEVAQTPESDDSQADASDTAANDETEDTSETSEEV